MLDLSSVYILHINSDSFTLGCCEPRKIHKEETAEKSGEKRSEKAKAGGEETLITET